MSRFLTSRYVRRVAHSVIKSGDRSYSEAGKYSAVALGLNLPRCRLYSHHRFPVGARSPAPFSFNSTRKCFEKFGFSRNLSTFSASNSVSHNAQIACKRLYQKCHSKPYTFAPIKKIALEVSLAIARSHPLVPGVFAIACGQTAWAQRSSTDTDFLSLNSLCMRAQDGHAYMASLLWAVLESFILLMRAFYLTVLFSPSIVMAPFADCCGEQYRKLWLHIVHRTLEKAGPAFIKWGQWAATRPDLFPRDLCVKLSELQTKAPEHSFEFTKKAIKRAFGRKYSEIFVDFDEAPVASGSIAQVYRASYRDPSQKGKLMEVAVKVRHPGVVESIRRDFTIINFAAKISTVLPTLRWLRLDESVQQFAVFMMSQVDLAREATNLTRFIDNFRRCKDVSFPKPVYPLVHPAVLVETFEQGEGVSHFVDELEGNNRVKSDLAHIGTRALLKMLLVDNFVHADLHPGNILVRVAPNTSPLRRLFKSKPHVVFLDVGMTAELSGSDRVNLQEFFKAVALRDGRTAAECTLRLSKQQNCPNPKAFIQEVDESFAFWGTREGDLVHPAECMQELLEKVRRHRVNIDGNVCTVLVTTLVLEGWQQKLDPSYNVMQTLQKLVLKADSATSLSYTIKALMAP